MVGAALPSAMRKVSLLQPYRGASLTRKRTPLGPYRRPMPRVLGESQGGALPSVMRKVHLPQPYTIHHTPYTIEVDSALVDARGSPRRETMMVKAL